MSVGGNSSYIVNAILAGAEAWRWMLALAVIPSVVLFVGILLLPETPRWLVSNGNVERARSVLGRIHGGRNVDTEISEIQRVEREERNQYGVRELGADWVRPMLVVGLGLAIFQQIVGINTIIYYAPTIIAETGLEAQTSIIATVGIGLVNFLMTFVAIWLIDKTGRKPLLLVGLIGMIAALLILSLGFLLPSLAGVISLVTMFGLLLYIASFAATFGPILWVMLPEIFPLKVRGAGAGVATIGNWGANFLVSLLFPILAAAIGLSAVFALLAVFSVAAFIFIRLLVPETKGRSLEEIESSLRGSAAATARVK